MPILFFVYLSVFLAVFLLHLIRFKVIIKYDRVLFITFKLLFFSYTFKPIKEEIDFAGIFSLDGLLNELDDIKSLIEFIFSKNKYVHLAYKEFISHLNYKLVYLDILVSTDSPSKTALAYSYTNSLISLVIVYLKSISRLEISRISSINVQPSFFDAKPYIKFMISSHISVASLILVWAKIGYRLLYSLISSQIREVRYGTKQTK